ncbi:DUF6678 family protein [Microbulbifer echini]|uniref:DUF6678 family protein n=1 Tax=Microbulbifer echini TaxID=1529067 RepID=A0ABV4NT21_9GAMM
MNEHISKIIDQRQLVSVMNKTKWRELCGSFSGSDSVSPEIRYKLIFGESIYGFSAVWWDEVFRDCVAIEWMDFDPFNHEFRGQLVSKKKIEIRNEIFEIFEKYNIPYSIEGGFYRVWGYIDRHVSPQFV